MIRAVRTASDRPFNVNVFCHRPAVRDSTREAVWLSRLSPIFSQYGAVPPSGLREIYTSFVEDDAMLAMLLEERPKVVSFHFGIPAAQRMPRRPRVRRDSALSGPGKVHLLLARCLLQCWSRNSDRNWSERLPRQGTPSADESVNRQHGSVEPG